MSERASRLPHHVLRLLGVVILLFAALGLWYNSVSLVVSFSYDSDTPHFRYAFYPMSAICIACYVALVVIGVQFIRLRTSWYKPFVHVIIFEVLYFFGVAILWMIPVVGHSVGAATGVANGGLMFQFMTLFPIWGPLVAWWATKAIDAPAPSEAAVFPEEQVARPSDWAWAAVNFVIIFSVAWFVIGLLLKHWSRSASASFSPRDTAGLAFLVGVANAYLSVKYRRQRREEVIQRRRDDRLEKGLCPRCEYNLTGNVSGVCPECGEPVAASKRD